MELYTHTSLDVCNMDVKKEIEASIGDHTAHTFRCWVSCEQAEEKVKSEGRTTVSGPGMASHHHS